MFGLSSHARHALLSTVFFTALAAPQTVRADSKDDARKHYERGVALADEGFLQSALVEFQKSYELRAHYAVMYNIGRLYVMLGRPVEAADTFEQYLAQGGKKIPEARRAEVNQEIGRQKARIATLEIRGLPGEVWVQIDGKMVGKTPFPSPLRVVAGAHVIVAEAEGFGRSQASVTVAGEDHKVVEMERAEPADEEPPAQAAPPEVAQPSPAVPSERAPLLPEAP